MVYRADGAKKLTPRLFGADLTSRALSYFNSVRSVSVRFVSEQCRTAPKALKSAELVRQDGHSRDVRKGQALIISAVVVPAPMQR